MKPIIKKTDYPDLIIVNGTAVNFINGKIDDLEFMKEKGYLNDVEIKAVDKYIKNLDKPKLKKSETKRLRNYIKNLHKQQRS